MDIKKVVEFINGCDDAESLALVVSTARLRQQELGRHRPEPDGKSRPLGTDVAANPGRDFGVPAGKCEGKA